MPKPVGVKARTGLRFRIDEIVKDGIDANSVRLYKLFHGFARALCFFWLYSARSSDRVSIHAERFADALCYNIIAAVQNKLVQLQHWLEGNRLGFLISRNRGAISGIQLDRKTPRCAGRRLFGRGTAVRAQPHHLEIYR